MEIGISLPADIRKKCLLVLCFIAYTNRNQDRDNDRDNDRDPLDHSYGETSKIVLVLNIICRLTRSKTTTRTTLFRQSVRNAVEKCLKATNADVIMGSGESGLPTIAAAAGYPIASVPLGFSMLQW